MNAGEFPKANQFAVQARKLAEAVASALARVRGIDSELVPKMAAAFAATGQLVRTFENEFGGRDCAQLLGCDISTAEGLAIFRMAQLHRRCERYTSRAAEIAAALLEPPA